MQRRTLTRRATIRAQTCAHGSDWVRGNNWAAMVHLSQDHLSFFNGKFHTYYGLFNIYLPWGTELSTELNQPSFQSFAQPATYSFMFSRTCIGQIWFCLWLLRTPTLRVGDVVSANLADNCITMHAPFYSSPLIFAVFRNLVQEIWFEKSGSRNLVQE